MALVFMDGFDHYTTLLQKWSTTNANPSITTGAARYGVNGFSANNQDAFAMTNSFTSNATWIVGVAVKLGGFGTNRIFGLYDTGTVQVDLRYNASNILYVTRNGTTLGTGTTPLVNGVWTYAELKVFINASTGTVDVRRNGVSEIALTSQNTKNTTNATANAVRLGGDVGGGGVYASFDDFYMCDGSGASPTDTFLGDVRVETLLPSGDGNSSQLVGSDGNSINNSLLVDEVAPNDDTDYVESSTVSDKDTYAFGNLTSTTGTVFGVQVLPWAKKTDAGTRSIVSVARLSGTEVDSATKTLSSSYSYLPDVREAKPGGGVWTISDVNSAEFGVKVTA